MWIYRRLLIHVIIFSALQTTLPIHTTQGLRYMSMTLKWIYIKLFYHWLCSSKRKSSQKNIWGKIKFSPNVLSLYPRPHSQYGIGLGFTWISFWRLNDICQNSRILEEFECKKYLETVLSILQSTLMSVRPSVCLSVRPSVP